MTVRDALFQDIPAICDLCEAARAASVYAPISALDRDACMATLFDLIGRHGTSGVGATRCIVADGAGRLDGAIVGVALRLHEALTVPMVTDLFWFVRPGAQPVIGRRLFEAIEAWAAGMARPVVLRCGVHSAIADPERTRKMLERKGMKRTGYIFERIYT